jgi:hypothetical protein
MGSKRPFTDMSKMNRPFALAFALSIASFLGCTPGEAAAQPLPAGTSAATPGPSAVPTAPEPTSPAILPPPASRYIDSYLLLRPSDRIAGLTLRLRGDGLATLRIEPPSSDQEPAQSPASSTDEAGTWIERNGFAYVHLTQRNSAAPGASPDLQAESVMLAFALKGCTLKLVGDPQHVYGPKGLQLSKRHCD